MRTVTRTDQRAGPAGLSRWPRMLFLSMAMLAFAVLAGLGACGLAVNKAVSPPAVGTIVIGIFTVAPGCVLAWLASPGEANPWRTTGIWIALLSYIGGIAALSLALIGDAVWQAAGHASLDLVSYSDPMPAGLVGSTAGALWGIAFPLAWLALPVFVPSSLYTLWTRWKRPHQAPEAFLAAGERERRIAGGFEVGAAVSAVLVTALGLAVALLCHYGLSSPMPAWSDGGRVALVSGTLAICTALVAAGIALHLRGGPGVLRGQALLWIGAVVLTVAGVLDSCSATSVSGTTGTYAASTTGDFSGGLLAHWIGLGTFLVPAGVLALLLAINVTHIHLPRHATPSVRR